MYIPCMKRHPDRAPEPNSLPRGHSEVMTIAITITRPTITILLSLSLFVIPAANTTTTTTTTTTIIVIIPTPIPTTIIAAIHPRLLRELVRVEVALRLAAQDEDGHRRGQAGRADLGRRHRVT